MSRRQSEEHEFCFVGMNDMMSDLVAQLILLVLLVTGVFRGGPRTDNAPPPPAPVQESVAPQELTKSARPLRLRLNELQAALKATDRDIAALDEKLPQLRQEVEELLTKSRAGAQKK